MQAVNVQGVDTAVQPGVKELTTGARRSRARQRVKFCLAKYITKIAHLSMKNHQHYIRILSNGVKNSAFALGALAALQGCAVVAVADTVGTIAVKTVGLAADAAIGVVRISGRAVGAAADVVVPDGK